MQNKFYLHKYFNINGEIEIETDEQQTKFKTKKRIDIFKEILVNLEIYIPSLVKLNDPFECLIPHQEKDPRGILSFTTNDNHPLMWAHYSDGHTGVVIRFNINKDFYKDFEKVQYIHNKSELALLKPFCAKSMDWNYENEYRLIFDSHSYSENLQKLGLQIDSILFGHRCSEIYKKEIRDICLAFDYKWGEIQLNDDLRCHCIGTSTEEDNFIWDRINTKRNQDEEEYRASYSDEDYSNYPSEDPMIELRAEAESTPEFQELLKEKERLKAHFRKRT